MSLLKSNGEVRGTGPFRVGPACLCDVARAFLAASRILVFEFLEESAQRYSSFALLPQRIRGDVGTTLIKGDLANVCR